LKVEVDIVVESPTPDVNLVTKPIAGLLGLSVCFVT